MVHNHWVLVWVSPQGCGRWLPSRQRRPRAQPWTSAPGDTRLCGRLQARLHPPGRHRVPASMILCGPFRGMFCFLPEKDLHKSINQGLLGGSVG